LKIKINFLNFITFLSKAEDLFKAVIVKINGKDYMPANITYSYDKVNSIINLDIVGINTDEAFYNITVMTKGTKIGENFLVR
jgi:hypothetical protein